MEDVRRILVPVDFSDCSAVALEYAIEFARPFEASIDALHVWSAPVYVPPTLAVQVAQTHDMTTLDALARRDADERMQALLARVAPGNQVAARIDTGDPLPVILELSPAYDLIIAGTHGRTGFSHLVLGSVAEKIVRNAERPVITVRCPPGQRCHLPVRKILAAVDFSSCSSLALKYANTLSTRLGATLDILHAATHIPIEGAELLVTGYAGESKTPFKEWAKRSAEEEMKRFLDTEMHVAPNEVLVALGDPVTLMLDTVADGDYDLLVIGTHGRSGVSRLIMGSIAEKIVRRSSRPVLSVREPHPPPPRALSASEMGARGI